MLKAEFVESPRLPWHPEPYFIASSGWLHDQKLLHPHMVLCGMHVLAPRRLAYHGAELSQTPHMLPPASVCIAHRSNPTAWLSQASAASAQYPLQLMLESLRAGLLWYSGAVATAHLQPFAPGPLSRAPTARGRTSCTGVQIHCRKRMAARMTLTGGAQSTWSQDHLTRASLLNALWNTRHVGKMKRM